jgi:S1/P1 Nuclease
MPLVLLGLTVLPEEAKAWGKFGHLVVCDLAYRNLTDASKEKLKQLFNGKRGITVKGKGRLPDRHYTSFNLGCLEEDELPRRNPDDHFINVSRDTKSIDGQTCPHNSECIFAGIERDLAILRNEAASKADRVFALMAIGHWIGDIHQPLHVSFADDRGGNRIDVKLQGKCGKSSYRVKNLHGMWDNCLLEAGLFERVRKRADFKKTWSKNTITYRAVDTLQVNTSLATEKSFVQSQSGEWATESYTMTLSPDVRYCTMVGEVCQYSPTMVTLPNQQSKRLQPLNQAYLAAFERVAEDRVKKAGFRLAHLLNLALDPSYSAPIQNSTQKP